MIAAVTAANVTTYAPSTPAPQPAVRVVEAPAPPANSGGSGSPSSGLGDLVRSARFYADLLQMTKDPRIAAMFSGFGPASSNGHVDVYA